MKQEKSPLHTLRAFLGVRDNQVYLLTLFRYSFPLLWALVLFSLGFSYNIRTGSLGRLSLWRLLFNTLREGRRALLAGRVTGEARGYYVLLLLGAAVALLAFVAALLFAALALSQFLRAAHGDREGARAARVLFRTVFPNRVALCLSNLLLLVTALFPTYFALVSTHHPGGGFISIKLDVVLIVSLVLAFLLLVLVLLLRRREWQGKFDMFYIMPEGEEGIDNGNGSDETAAEEAD